MDKMVTSSAVRLRQLPGRCPGLVQLQSTASRRYLTTMKYIHKFLEQGMRILEVGSRNRALFPCIKGEEGFPGRCWNFWNTNLNILRSKRRDGMRTLRQYTGRCPEFSRYRGEYV